MHKINCHVNLGQNLKIYVKNLLFTLMALPNRDRFYRFCFDILTYFIFIARGIKLLLWFDSILSVKSKKI